MTTLQTAKQTEAPSDLVRLDEIERARRRIITYVRHTPSIRSRTLSERLNTNVYLKLELFQKTGAFKVRGAFNRMLSLSDQERQRGVVAVSAGNHAQAVAFAAREMGIRAVILMPESTPVNYLEATAKYGAQVMLAPTLADAFKEAQVWKDEGWAYVHPFDDAEVIAGQGTIGLEILNDIPQVTDVLVAIGGGGLAGGVAAAIKSQRQDARIWGVETEGADSMARALEAGRIVEMQQITSAARTLGAPAVGKIPFALARRYLEGVTVVSDNEAFAALRLILERVKVLTEMAASCTLAAAEQLRERFSPSSHVVLILCGGNLSVDDLCRMGRG
jgi:threonine dehydratase